jgi:hypothetical protein
MGDEMKRAKQAARQYKVSSKEASSMILRYIRQKIAAQIKAVASIILYLLLFQTIVLGIPITQASVIALGMAMVILGLSFFMEGLLLGIMPMGEEIGIRLPQKTGTGAILIIAFILGVGATLAEPAIGVLKAAGSSVSAWQAPLLFLFLNKHSAHLVAAVGFGVGFALILGMFRFLKGHSLKPYIYVLISLLLALSLYAYLDPNLRHLMGLAWDCGGVTTGPVTVPLVLALGIGISHVANKGGDNTEGGFGIVTLASLVPVIAVLILGIFYSFKVPAPMPDTQFFARENPSHLYLFEDEQAMRDYAIGNASYAAQLQLFGNSDASLATYVSELGRNAEHVHNVFGSQQAFRAWLLLNGTESMKDEFRDVLTSRSEDGVLPNLPKPDIRDFIRRNVVNASRAIIPLSIFLLIVLYIVLRERLGRPDEVLLGLAFAVIGMAIFSGGIELGLSKLGDQVGSNLPVSFATMEVTDGQEVIRNFDASTVYTALRPDGSKHQFFYYEDAGKIQTVPYTPENHDPLLNLYRYIPTRGPLFGRHPYSMAGILVVLIFAFIMGYSATLAEPALNALGITVEDLTVGAFKKSQLILSVAIGVGAGITLGVAKIIWNLPLLWLLGPLYLILLIFTRFSSEDFVNIGWDSAGVTTGPITVPLVLSMGLGIGSQVGVAEGFGILSLASACPIISVLGMGLYVNYKRRMFLKEYEPDTFEITPEEMNR